MGKSARLAAVGASHVNEHEDCGGTEASLCFLDNGSAVVFIRTQPQRQPRELRLFAKVKT